MIERLQKQTRWHQSTIKTLLTRLVKKKAATRQRDGRRFFYSPLVQRETILAKESERLLNRFFDGEIAPLVAHFADRKQISKRDLEKIQMILSNLKDRDA
jgi:predicted transcriptional regulator